MHMDIRVCRKHEDQFKRRGGIQFESIKALLNVYLSGFRKIYSLWHIMGSFGLILHELICKWFWFFMYTLWVATQTRSQSCILVVIWCFGLATHPSQLRLVSRHTVPVEKEIITSITPVCRQTGSLWRKLRRDGCKVWKVCNTTLFQTLGLIFKWNPKKRNFNLSQTLFFYR